MFSSKRFYLILDGENFGPITYSTNDVEYASANPYDGIMIDKPIFKTAVTYTFYLPGLIVKARKFSVFNKDESQDYHIWLDSDECLIFQLYPDENKEPYIKLIDKLQSDNLPYEVYNEDGASGWLPEKKAWKPTYPAEDDDDDLDEQERLLELLPDLNNQIVCPECSTYENSIWYVVQHMNDTHKWKREKIADWLETLDADITFPIGEENGNED